MSRISSLGNIKSRQSGTIAIASNATAGVKTNTATITGVDTAKAVLINLGAYSDNFTASGIIFSGASLALTDSTTVTASAYATQASAATLTVGYEVVEYL